MAKQPKKNAAAQALVAIRYASMSPKERSEAARNAGLAGGPARAAALTEKRRSEIAKKAAAARWAKKK